MVITAGIAGLIAGIIMIFASHMAPRLGAGAFVKEVDVIKCFGRTCSRRESHIIGMLVHGSLYIAAGLVYGALAEQGVVSGFGAIPLLFYAALLTVFMGGVIIPLEGHGMFGWREDHWFAVDLIIMNLVWVILFGMIMQLIV